MLLLILLQFYPSWSQKHWTICPSFYLHDDSAWEDVRISVTTWYLFHGIKINWETEDTWNSENCLEMRYTSPALTNSGIHAWNNLFFQSKGIIWGSKWTQNYSFNSFHIYWRKYRAKGKLWKLIQKGLWLPLLKGTQLNLISCSKGGPAYWWWDKQAGQLKTKTRVALWVCYMISNKALLFSEVKD